MGTTLLADGRWTWHVWLQTILVSLVGTLLLRMGALAVFDIPAEFPPLATVGPTILLTVLGVAIALAVALLVGQSASQPVQLFRTLAIVALLLSFLPDAWMLTDGAAVAFPGATVPGVITLMLQHVVAAFIVIWMLTMRGQQR